MIVLSWGIPLYPKKLSQSHQTLKLKSKRDVTKTEGSERCDIVDFERGGKGLEARERVSHLEAPSEPPERNLAKPWFYPIENHARLADLQNYKIIHLCYLSH